MPGLDPGIPINKAPFASGLPGQAGRSSKRGAHRESGACSALYRLLDYPHSRAMTAVRSTTSNPMVTLSTDRISLRRWRDADREPFAAMNADARVMEFFRAPLSRAESDRMVDHIEAHFGKHGFGLWAIEVPGVAPFIGFTGIAHVPFSAPFTPCVEIGWRLAFPHWGHGYATEAARLALDDGFGPRALSEIVSFTSVTNRRSRAVMERLGMRRDPAEDFDHPAIAEGHPLRRHVLYRLDADSFAAR
jgi:RimJ/RimL family protein N-acetyltransferase